ncbi:FixH family protein [Hazenella sp. IB182357]|uniref:FixH family protein n=1 Tax=Polycladospora coralii TaxID=2771432 RepID=A0A926RXD2_9BACL|nr:FixH family protein [Polycladospora coralii]MBD1372406.1 FixH family protein [Polycladospora coralii]MBS7531404.1 FixH family protein [Polycladospora coralii]
MKIIKLGFLGGLCIFFMISLLGCGQETDKSEHSGMNHGSMEDDKMNEELTIQFATSEESIKKNEAVTLTADIKKADVAVTDAKVEFEVWKKEQKEHTKTEATQQKDGVYEAEVKYEEEGQYEVIVHVTTPTTHQMISKQFQVEK